MSKEKDTIVIFSHDNMFSNVAGQRKTIDLKMGRLNYRDAARISCKWQERSQKKPICFTNYGVILSCYSGPFYKYPTICYSLKLHDMFFGYIEHLNDPEQPIVPLCIDASDPKKIPHDEHAMALKCMENLRTGKCKNKLMCETLGAKLFPQFYAAQKNVKGK